MSTSDYICETENIAAYIEGDLEPALQLALEEHLKECAGCASELRAQRLFMCELDSALANPFDLEVPANFARVVAVNAKSDMRGMRDASEHAILSVRSLAGKVFGALGFFAEAIFNAAAGFAVIFRVLTRGLISNSRLSGLAGLLLVVLAIAVLSRLITRYHRTRLIE